MSGGHVLPNKLLLGLSLFKAIIFSIYIHWLYVAAAGKCFYKERLANSRDGKFQLIKTAEKEKPHFRMVNIDRRSARRCSGCLSPALHLYLSSPQRFTSPLAPWGHQEGKHLLSGRCSKSTQNPLTSKKALTVCKVFSLKVN